MKEVSSLPSTLNRQNGLEWIGKQESDLFTSMQLLQNEDEIRNFLLDIFSRKELQSAAKRFCAARQLLEGVPQKDIERTCGMHRNTVSLAKKLILDSGTGMTTVIHDRLKKFKKIAPG